ncbi:hypothetical protein HOF17_04110 [Candidatus Peribacteria bacterium]|jgi:hypothetical protein|nr:hypothetical protein [Candidatus Peribacteria bacterium]
MLEIDIPPGLHQGIGNTVMIQEAQPQIEMPTRLFKLLGYEILNMSDTARNFLIDLFQAFDEDLNAKNPSDPVTETIESRKIA